MSLTLQEYATYLDSRSDLAWPAPPRIEPAPVQPTLTRLGNIRAVTWSVYGTLLCIQDGQLHLEHPNRMMMEIALDKVIQEFKMWASMSRKPGQPAEYFREIYANVLTEQRSLVTGGDKYAELPVERVWEAIVKKLMQKDYRFDTVFMGSLNEFSRKVAYFFHRSLQGVACFEGAALALKSLQERGLQQGILANTQCFTLIELERGLVRQAPGVTLSKTIAAELRGCSHELHSRLPGERPFRHVLGALAAKGIQPQQVLHVGSRMAVDVLPARRHGMKTALFAGDKSAYEADAVQAKDPHMRPDVVLTELTQIAEIVG